jgi:hypothetical protein
MSMYAKNYASYEWKRDVVGFDLYRLTPWLQRIHHSDDLDFHDALFEYLGRCATRTPHVVSVAVQRIARFHVDIYDGKVLIDTINRTLLPQAQYPFGVGDELVALDGEAARASSSPSAARGRRQSAQSGPSRCGANCSAVPIEPAACVTGG